MSLTASTIADLAAVQELEDKVARAPQVDIDVEHTLHAGIYARTLRLDAGVVVVGALIKVPTILIISGEGYLKTGVNSVRVSGYTILCGDDMRRAAFYAESDCCITMSFATSAESVDKAEQEFTDDFMRLTNRRENLCLVQ